MIPMEDGIDSSTALHVDLSKHKPSINYKRVYIPVLCAVVVAFVIGILVGWFSHHQSSDRPQVITQYTRDEQLGISEQIFAKVNPENIKAYLRKWTNYSHLAGTPGEAQLAGEIHQTWLAQGFDHVAKKTYDVLLSYPNTDNPSKVQLIDSTGGVVFQSQIEEKPLEASQKDIPLVLPYNGYSAAGVVKSNLLYVNYGRLEDFQHLQSQNITINGTIVIARYGKIFRGDKAKFAELFGAGGLILYTDPLDYSNTSVPPYPNSWWLPDTGVQRGTIYALRGDPLTPGYPAKDYAYRIPENAAEIPLIPVHPISFGDAWTLLSKLKGPAAPSTWQGGLNITYNYGPGFIDSHLKLKLTVTTERRRTNTTNVFAIIRGEIEPDRYILLGNHIDSWVLGAVDPTSGTATMMEVARVFAQMRLEGWRPRRSIIFCAWGAEEFGLIGSYEWTEDFLQVLTARAVAYLNVDMSISGSDSMRAYGVPMLFDSLYKVAKMVETPNEKGRSMYDEWLATFPAVDYNNEPTGYPAIGPLGAGSDYAAFQAFAGVSSVDFRYTYGPQYRLSSYPLYHSAYETFHLVNDYIDPDMKYSAAIARYWAELARYLADSYVLPLNVSRYPEVLSNLLVNFKKGYGSLLQQHNISLDYLERSISKFKEMCHEFTVALEHADYSNPLEIKAMNDQLMMVERAFLHPGGLPKRPIYRHVIFAPSMSNSYSGSGFPGLVDLISDAEKSPQSWEEVQKHLGIIIYAIDSASSVLQNASHFI